MTLKVYISGTFVDKDAAKVSVFDHGFLFGDGIFEGMRSYGGRVFRHREHLERLWESARSDSVIVNLEMQIEKLQEYRQSVISEAVTGKVVCG